MSKIKESLEKNKEEILKALPEEFHADLEKEIEAAKDPAPLSDEEELEAIKKELTDNHDVVEGLAIPQLEKAPTAHKPSPLPSEEEQKKEMEERLKKVEAAGGVVPEE